MLSSFGGVVLQRPLTYEDWCALWFNLDRVMTQRAWSVKTGIEMALSRSPIDPSIFESVTKSESEANELEHRTNTARHDAKVRAKYGLQ